MISDGTCVSYCYFVEVVVVLFLSLFFTHSHFGRSENSEHILSACTVNQCRS